MNATLAPTDPLERLLGALPKARIVAIGRDAKLTPQGKNKTELASSLARTGRLSFRRVLAQLRRDELRQACRVMGLDDGGRARQELMARLLAHAAHSTGAPLQSQPPPPLFGGSTQRGASEPRHVPQLGDTVIARHRQWLVTERSLPVAAGDATRVQLTCLDDDHRGQTLQLLWELELGARVIPTDLGTLGEITHLDEPRHYAAYLHALRWQMVTASERDFFQAPFRAGVEILDHQLTPLQKALALPRANLFIADDVGLGKTIEAGLVLQELLLRQRVEMALIVCPASITLQWQREMDQRFGLHFEIVSRDFVLACRRERGFGVNPWATHQRFIISYPLLRRPEYRDGLVALLDERTEREDGRAGLRARKSLLILDEAHAAAPSSGGRYAVDSQTTRVIRDIAPRFENRLFLSATPHNGHSNSFSALLEILDPQRFARGVPVGSPEELRPVMVRRLKRDLRALGKSIRFPERQVVRVGLQRQPAAPDGSVSSQPTESGPEHSSQPTESGPEHSAQGASWVARFGDREVALPMEAQAYDELSLAADLAEYTTLFEGQPRSRRLALVNLQKRLLSSVEAFARTLRVHRETKARHLDAQQQEQHQEQTDAGGARLTRAERSDEANLDQDEAEERERADAETTLGLTDEEREATEDARTAEASAALHAIMPPGGAALLERMSAGAENLRRRRCAKTEAWLAWVRRELCSLSPEKPLSEARRWADRRVIVFTEYSDTLRYLRAVLAAELGEALPERVVELRGGMDEEARADVQRAFNADPADEPVRILLATDAAREGLNLQAHCQDLFHFDIPWNPSRMEQRNGRIDRALQPASEVRCHYFVYEDRAEDRVLDKLVHKTAVIHEELGSLGEVVAERVSRALAQGIDRDSEAQLDLATGTQGASSSGPSMPSMPNIPSAATAPSDASAAHEPDAERMQAALATSERELEGTRAHDALAAELVSARKVYEKSRKRLQLESAHLRDALEVGLELAGVLPRGANLEPAALDRAASTGSRSQAYRLPESFGADWQRTLDPLRPPRKRDEDFFEWRQRPPRPVVFEAPKVLSQEAVHLHLEHPFVKRVLSRFMAQGFSSHDLSRVTAVALQGDPVVLALGRLSLFGAGAGRLHDAILCAAARLEGPQQAPVVLDHAESLAELQRLERHLKEERPTLERLGPRLRRDMVERAPSLLAALLPALHAEADSEALEVEQRLQARGRSERAQLTELLQTQQRAIQEALGGSQLQLDFGHAPTRAEQQQLAQLSRDRAHLERRQQLLEQEIATEPADLEALYEVKLRRFEPIGLVYLVPEIAL